MGGASSNEGKLEYCHNGAWSSFCIVFDDEEATVACKQLGFTGSSSKNVCRNKYKLMNIYTLRIFFLL